MTHKNFSINLKNNKKGLIPVIAYIIGGVIATTGAVIYASNQNINQYSHILKQDDRINLIGKYYNDTLIYNQTTNSYQNPEINNILFKLNVLYNKLLMKENELQTIPENTQIFTLKGKNCKKIEFDIYKPINNSIVDNAGLNILNEIGHFINLEKSSYLYLNYLSQEQTNNFNITYDYIEEYSNAFRVGHNNDYKLKIETNNNISLSQNNINILMMLERVKQYSNLEVFKINQAGQDKLKVYQKHNKIYFKNLVDNSQLEINPDDFNLNNYDYFNLNIKVNDDKLDIKINNILAGQINNPFDIGKHKVVFDSSNYDNSKSIFIRSVIFKTPSTKFIPSNFKLDNELINIDTNNWEHISITPLKNNIYYQIGNKFRTIDYPTNITKDNYNISINLTTTSIKDVYCRK